MLTKDLTFPTDEELTCQELKVGFPVLQAAAFTMGKYCEFQMNEFSLCRDETQDARKCIDQGKLLTACGLEYFRKVKKHCSAEFTQYWKCIDHSSGNGNFAPCRTTQAVFDKCALEHLNVERPGFGYFCEVKIHDSERPKPPPEPININEPAPLPRPDMPRRNVYSKMF